METQKRELKLRLSGVKYVHLHVHKDANSLEKLEFNFLGKMEV